MQVSIIAGTRPEIIKLAPLRGELERAGIAVDWIDTGQHEDLARQALADFALSPDRRLNLSWDRTRLTSLSSALIWEIGDALGEQKPDMVLVQGDTASAHAGATAAFLNRIPIGHVEAGLRAAHLGSPFPEEGFRRLIAPIADLHFAPTRVAARNLRREGVDPRRVMMTGNTVVDAVRLISALDQAPPILSKLRTGERLVMVTMHRRENWDGAAERVCRALLRLRNAHPDIRIVFPVHANPRVADPVRAMLSGEDRIELIEALDYPGFIALMRRAYLILSDSGGVQEEAPTFGAPVLVLRNETERMEAVTAGVARLVGTQEERIFYAAHHLLSRPRARARMVRTMNPFGDGYAARRIASVVRDFLKPGRGEGLRGGSEAKVSRAPALVAATLKRVREKIYA